MTVFRNGAAQRLSVGWAEMAGGLRFMVQIRTKPGPQADVIKTPIRWDGRALRGDPAGLDAAQGADRCFRF